MTQVSYELKREGRSVLTYKDLREYFGDRQPTPQETRDAVLRIRRSKSMVIDENDPNSRSAGSFFKNPIVDQVFFTELAARVAPNAVPSFPMSEGRVKIPAAWLIENSGFHKGYRCGDTGISANHSLAIVNYGNATAAEIIELRSAIQEAVQNKFGIELVPEPEFIGFDPQKEQPSSSS